MNEISVLSQAEAERIISSLRSGIPPRLGTGLYAADGGFSAEVRRRFFAGGITCGKIRFAAGTWGSGKTHLFRVLAEHALDEQILVSTVELNQAGAPFDKLERVLGAIITNITSPARHAELGRSAVPFEQVLQDATRGADGGVQDADRVEAVCQSLLARADIDIDVRRVLAAYLRTLPHGDAESAVETRGLLMAWFRGEPTIGEMRRRFKVNKLVTKDTARALLGSLGGIADWLGYRGLLILLDESEMSTSIMRTADRQRAHNNLLHLINEIELVSGVMLIYAAVPEFWHEPRTGIITYGALHARVGEIPNTPPRPLRPVWNVELLNRGDGDFQHAAARIRALYLQAYPEECDALPGEDHLAGMVTQLLAMHPERHQVSSWRIVVSGTVRILDDALEGVQATAETAYVDVLEVLRHAN